MDMCCRGRELERKSGREREMWSERGGQGDIERLRGRQRKREGEG